MSVMLAKAFVTADLPPCGGDVRQDRGGWEGSPTFDVSHSHLGTRLGAWQQFVDRLAGQHPPLSCRTSPPQGGRSAVVDAFANHEGEGA
ncbi:MAG: hypothetical protein EOR56_05155 [Mesorhizobium sp.]|nr:MAG: hypothetical protein EOR54_07115 [Mesorhizobium sp.]RWL15662.1 MAG: hypothetical protein EOR56_05155 [Mesorhizobium sp.]